VQPGELLVIDYQLQQFPARNTTARCFIGGSLLIEQRLVQSEQTAAQIS